jgi:hypothetical protein
VEIGKIFDEEKKNFGGSRRALELVEEGGSHWGAGTGDTEVQGGRTLPLPDGLSDLRLQCSRI